MGLKFKNKTDADHFYIYIKKYIIISDQIDVVISLKELTGEKSKEVNKHLKNLEKELERMLNNIKTVLAECQFDLSDKPKKTRKK